MRPRWKSGPASITLVRHGESVGNAADAAAREADAEQLDLTARDADVELSPTGQEQADALGWWLSGSGQGWSPTMVVSSPYRRAVDTATRATEAAGLPVELDERLRERDFGIFDGLTGRGIRARHPEEAARRTKLGKFYYQPPSGESWADVALRVRSLVAELRHGHDDEHVWLFTHQAVIMAFRYVLEDIDEPHLLDIDRQVQIPNVSMTRYERSHDVFDLVTFADTRGVDDDARVTREESP